MIVIIGIAEVTLMLAQHNMTNDWYILQVEIDESVDEMASYFNRETVPKALITTSDRPSQVRN